MTPLLNIPNSQDDHQGTTFNATVDVIKVSITPDEEKIIQRMVKLLAILTIVLIHLMVLP